MKIVIINCGKIKRNIVTTVNNMYIGKLFQKSYNYAKSLNPDKIFILSAKYILPYVKNYTYPIEHLRVGFRMKFFTEETNKNKESLCII